MFRSLDFYGGLAIGAGLMYVMDPQQGKTRRAKVRDQAIHGSRATRDFLGKAGRDFRNRAAGAVAETRSRFRHEHPPDEVLEERVRAKLGRYVSHPHAIEVQAEQGCVVLRGPILQTETKRLIDAVSSVPGVTEVVNHLEEHARADNVPSLQGGVRPAGEPPEWAQSNWTPSFRLLAGILGLAAIIAGARRFASRGDGSDLDGDFDLEREGPEYAMLR